MALLSQRTGTAGYFMLVSLAAFLGSACRVTPPGPDDGVERRCDVRTACPATLVCDLGQGRCVADCRHQDGDYCQLPQGCDASSGLCAAITDCRTSFVHCPDTAYCDEYTGQCLAGARSCLEEGVACGGDQLCNPLSEACEDVPHDCRLPAIGCPSGYGCDLLSGACLPGDCRTDEDACTDPQRRCNALNGQCDLPPDCRLVPETCDAASEQCDPFSGQCVPL